MVLGDIIELCDDEVLMLHDTLEVEITTIMK